MLQGDIEKKFLSQGKQLIGVDEVGRGCIAGPVFAACTSLDYAALDALSPADRALIRDSKTLSHEQRSRVIPAIQDIAVEAGIGMADVSEVETLGIVQATFLAMKRALALCFQRYDILLIDGRAKITGYQGTQEAIIKGDSLCYAIAAASIIAKEARDDYMRHIASKFPLYGFDKHVGYGTNHHREMIRAHGLCPLHRRNFSISL